MKQTRFIIVIIYGLILLAGGYVFYSYYYNDIQMTNFKYFTKKRQVMEKLKFQLKSTWQDQLSQIIIRAKKVMQGKPGNINKALAVLENTREDIQRAFFLDKQIIYLSRWKKIRRKKELENFSVGILYHPEFKLAEILEYQDKDYSAAIELYEKFWVKNPDKFYAAMALARCLYKAEDYSRALKLYRQIYTQNSAAQNQAEIPLALTAAFQILNINQKLGTAQTAGKFGLIIYQDLLDERWQLSEEKNRYFIGKIRKILKAFKDQPAIKHNYYQLLKKEKHINADKKYIRLISQNIIPFIEEKSAQDYVVYLRKRRATSRHFLLIIPYGSGHLILDINLDQYITASFLRTIKVMEKDDISIALQDGSYVLKTCRSSAIFKSSFILDRQFPDLTIDIILNSAAQQGLGDLTEKIKRNYFGGGAAFIIIISLFFWVLYKQIRLAEMRSEFVSHVSHELKTPITSLRAFSELIQTRTKLPPKKLKQYCGFIRDESIRLARLIDNLFMITRMERKKAQYIFVQANVDQVVQKAVKLFAKISVSRKHRIKMRLEADITTLLDKDAMIRVLLNLLDNAVKHSEDSSVIRINSTRRKQEVMIEVIDEGIGMTKSEIRKVFKEFYQVRKTYEEKYKGVGLGLAIVKNIVRAHKGYILIQSKVNQGTNVKVCLPITV
ncbi:GHKL domain-containing protein [bacterium]|nr:GHKL domain-containing protein [bacterium]